MDSQGFTGYFWARILYCFILLIEELSRKSLFIQESRPFLLGPWKTTAFGGGDVLTGYAVR